MSSLDRPWELPELIAEVAKAPPLTRAAIDLGRRFFATTAEPHEEPASPSQAACPQQDAPPDLTRTGRAEDIRRN